MDVWISFLALLCFYPIIDNLLVVAQLCHKQDISISQEEYTYIFTHTIPDLKFIYQNVSSITCIYKCYTMNEDIASVIYVRTEMNCCCLRRLMFEVKENEQPVTSVYAMKFIENSKYT